MASFYLKIIHTYTHVYIYTYVHGVCIHTHTLWLVWLWVISFSFLDLNYFSRFSTVYYFYNRKMLNNKTG